MLPVPPIPFPDVYKRQEEHIITIPEGEHHKSLESVAEIWQVLSDQGARRNAVLVNVGGGVITDLGGFAASCFKRGIHCVNIPTTLLAQIDASVGGKTGFDFNGLKNEIGSFAIPDWVLIDNHFLATLPERQIMSGFAEMLKHALLADEEHLAEAMQVDFAGVAEEDFLKLIRKSVAVKAAIVQSDPREKGLRKALTVSYTHLSPNNTIVMANITIVTRLSILLLFMVYLFFCSYFTKMSNMLTDASSILFTIPSTFDVQ